MGEKILIEEINCCHPTAKFPYYHAKVKITNGNPKDYFINKIIANGRGVRDYLIFLGDQYIDDIILKERSTSWLVVRVDWEVNDEVIMKIELVSYDGKENITLSKEARTPQYGGYYDKNWKYYFSPSRCSLSSF